MRVTVKLVGGLIQRLGFDEQPLDLPAGTTAGALLAAFGIPFGSVVTTRNGRGISHEEAMADGDRILVSPPFSGG